MNKTLACVLSACVLIAVGPALINAGQDRTAQPGQPTQGKVLVQNRGETEAVPVMIHNPPSAPPLRVQVMGIPVVTIGSGTVVQERVIRQP